MSDNVKYGLAGVIADDTAVSKVMPESNSLTYRGYPVQDLAKDCSFEQTAYVIWHGQLPSKSQLADFISQTRANRGLGEDVIELAKSLSRKAHPMDRLRTLVSYVGQKDEEQKNDNRANLLRQSYALFEKIPQMIAIDQRLMRGQTLIAPEPSLSFAENFFHMCFGEVPDKDIVRCFDISLTLYAEHSFNASTFAARVIASTLSDLYSAVTGGIGALKGSLHGGANEAVMDVLLEISTVENVVPWLEKALAEKRKIMGFGHRVYRGGDSRVPTMTEAFAKMVAIKNDKEAIKMFEISRLLAEEMIKRKNIFPNLDFPAGPAYFLMGFDISLFTPIFVMSRITGWSAHIIEQLENNKLIRPLSNYTGEKQRQVLSSK